MRTRLILAMMAVVAATSFGAVPSFYDDFDVLYAVGQTFMTPTNGWQASGEAAYVTNGAGYLGTKAVVMEGTVALTNTLNANANLRVWSDFRIKPILGLEDMNLETNASSFSCYFSTNGMMMVASPSGWQIYTNDIWGNPVAPVSGDAYVRFSIFQDYNTSNQAVFLNDQLIVQDLAFMGTAGSYSNLVIANSDSNCWLDNVWVKTNFDAATLTNNLNGDSLADAREVNDYGYARRTFYVSQMATALTPLFASITDALSVCRSRDVIHVIAGDYSSESIVLAANLANVVFEGDAFTIGSLTVVSNASVSFAQNVACGTFSLTGQVTMASGASLTASTAHVVGSLSVSGGGALVVTTLEVGGAGIVTFTNAQLIASGAGIVMNGTFAISNTWGSATLVSMPLPFSDDFDLYAEDAAMANFVFRGWSASDGTVKVGTTAHSGKAVVLPSETMLSNSISSASTKIWTDIYIRPVLGFEPSDPATNTSSFLAYVNMDGHLVVATAGGWRVCSNQVDNAPATVFQSNAFSRISVCQDLSFSPPKFAVFVAGNLVAQQLTSPGSINLYRSFAADNRDGSAYLDDVLISTTVPPGLSSDANEIHIYGQTLASMPHGTGFTFR